MKEFLYWTQVQQRLTEHFEKTGQHYSFYDATKAMWEEGLAIRGEEFPRVSFEQWDLSDPEEFDRLFGQTPVDLSHFRQDFDRNLTAVKASETVVVPEVIPYRLAWDQAVGIHRHVSFEVLYIMNGEAELLCKGNSRMLSKGTLCVLAPNLQHDVLPRRGSQVLSIMLSEVTLEGTLTKLLRQESVLADFFQAGLEEGKTGYITFRVPNDEPVRRILRNMFHEYYMRQDYGSQVCESYTEILFAQILRQCGGVYEQHNEEAARREGVPMLAVLKYLQQHFRTVSLGDMAAVFHYEPSYLGKQIKATTGKSYTEIVRDLRLREAKRLLRETDESMEEIGRRAGYNNQVHFFREFRSKFEETPGAYRRRKEQEGSAQ